MGHTTSSATKALICCGIAAAFMVSGCNGNRSYSLGGGGGFGADGGQGARQIQPRRSGSTTARTGSGAGGGDL